MMGVDYSSLQAGSQPKSECFDSRISSHLASFYIHQMNGVSSRNGFATILAAS